MRQKDIYFMPLGGAQSVGRSCYYLRLGQSNILLDCGLQRINGATCSPDFRSLLTSQFMESMQQLDHVYISHAHTDHVGYLPQLMQMAPQASVYMTLQTKQLAEYRLVANSSQQGAAEASRLLSNVAPVNYLQKIKQRDYTVTFFPAGHIPGAMMKLFEYAGRKILYTGDYSLQSAFGLDGCWLPDDLEVDVLLMCALHVKQPYSVRKKNTLQQRISDVMSNLRYGQSVYLQAFDPGRVLELLMALNREMEQSGQVYPIYLEPEAMGAVHVMESLQLPVLQQNNYSSFYAGAAHPHIVIGTKRKEQVSWRYRLFGNAYTLHEDYGEMLSFIRRLNPRQAYLVHCAEGYYGNTVEQELMRDAQCRTQVVFPEEGDIYTI